MSSKIIASTSSGTALNMSADTSGILEIQTGATPTTAITVDASQNVGIGTSSPTAKLESQLTSTTTPSLRLRYNSSSYYFDASMDGNGNTVFMTPSANGVTSGNFLFGAGGSERMRIDSSGKWYLNTTTSNYNSCGNFNFNGFGNGLDTKWAGTSSIYHLLCTNANGLIGGIQTSGSTTSFVTSSDYRLKENVKPMVNALDKVSALKPVTYTWKADGSDGQGFIAHELQAVVPDCVIGEKDAVNEDGSIKPQSIDTSFLVATLTAAIQEQQALITTLQTQVAALQNKVGVA